MKNFIFIVVSTLVFTGISLANSTSDTNTTKEQSVLSDAIEGINNVFNIHYTQALVKDFETDGCSAYPEGNKKDRFKWMACCLVHDVAYYRGGSNYERFKADTELGLCVARKDTVAHGKAMMAGVFIGGSASLPTSWRWAYGWESPSVALLQSRKYEEVTNQEAIWLQEKLETYDCDKKIKEFAQSKNWPITQSKVDSICEEYRQSIDVFRKSIK